MDDGWCLFYFACCCDETSLKQLKERSICWDSKFKLLVPLYLWLRSKHWLLMLSSLSSFNALDQSPGNGAAHILGLVFPLELSPEKLSDMVRSWPKQGISLHVYIETCIIDDLVKLIINVKDENWTSLLTKSDLWWSNRFSGRLRGNQVLKKWTS